MTKPHSPSCDRNRDPILDILKNYLDQKSGKLLEVGSGTGQHGCYFANAFPNIIWQFSDRIENHPGIESWRKDENLGNLLPPLEYNIGQNSFPSEDVQFVFTANTLHIMSWELCLQFFNDLKNTPIKTQLFIYGPFNYNGSFSSPSNEQFEDWLKARDPLSGIRDFESVVKELKTSQFELIEDHKMPANNQLLVFQKIK